MENQKTYRTDTQAISESEQMYLLKIIQLEDETTLQPVPISSIAQALEIQPVSANQMIHSLQKAGFVDYKPYKGVTLTQRGQSHAKNVLRFRRLWQTFLNKQLNLGEEDAEKLACCFEHATTEEAANQLEDFLYPLETAIVEDPPCIQLSDLTLDQPARILTSPIEKKASEFLQAQGLVPGIEVKIVGRGVWNDLLLKGPAGFVHLSEQIASEILVVTNEEVKS